MEISNPSQSKRFRPPIFLAFLLGFFLLAVDIGTKLIADAQLPMETRVPTAIPFFWWRLTYNTGSHYLLGSIARWAPYRLVMGIAALAVVVLIVIMAREVKQMSASPLRTIQWLMVGVLSGALGNALEVLARGRATDFFMIDPFPWPANICDQYVNAVVFVLLPLSVFFTWRSGEG